MKHENQGQDPKVMWPPQKDHHQYPDFLTSRVDKFFNERVKKTWSGGHIMRGRLPDENALHLSNNDYLSIANHHEVVEAQIASLLSEGNGDKKSAIFNNGHNPQREFERRMAEFLQAEDVLLAQSGWCANVGLIQSIAEKSTPIYIDFFAHMSLWEGIQSAGAKPYPFRHNSVTHLEKLIKKHGQGIVVIDSVYSTNGDVAPIEEIVDIANKHECVIIVDESHSLATHGPHGEGMVASLGLADKVHFRTSSMAKGFPGRAGIIVCSARHREYLMCESLPAIFSSALLPHDLHAFIAMIDVVKKESWRRVKLHRNADFLREELRHMGYNVEPSKSQIIALEAGSEEQMIILRDALEKQGIFGSIFCAPATPAKRALMRITVNASLTPEDIERVSKACFDIRDEVDMKNWASTLRLQRDLRRTQNIAKRDLPPQPMQVSPTKNNIYHLPHRQTLLKCKNIL